MVKASVKADVVLFGENHNDPISHWLQLELTKSLFKKHKSKLMLGAEMIESDNQIQLNEYLKAARNVFSFEFDEDIKFKQSVSNGIIYQVFVG